MAMITRGDARENMRYVDAAAVQAGSQHKNRVVHACVGTQAAGNARQQGCQNQRDERYCGLGSCRALASAAVLEWVATKQVQSQCGNTQGGRAGALRQLGIQLAARRYHHSSAQLQACSCHHSSAASPLGFIRAIAWPRGLAAGGDHHRRRSWASASALGCRLLTSE